MPKKVPMHKKKINKKISLNYYLLKVTKFHGDSVKNKSAITTPLTDLPQVLIGECS